MAKMNGIELKSIVKFYGRERNELHEADIFIENKKIGHWCEDYSFGPADIRLDPKYDEKKLVNKIIAYNKDELDPFEVSLTDCDDDTRPWDGFKDSCLEHMLPSLVLLKEWERSFKKHQKKFPNAILVVATDGYHEYTGLFGNTTKEEALNAMKKENFDFLKSAKEKYHVFTDLKEFNISRYGNSL